MSIAPIGTPKSNVDPVIIKVKEEHLPDFAFFFKEAVEEYSSMFATTKKHMLNAFYPEDSESKTKASKIKITLPEIISLTDKVIDIAVQRVKEKYPEEYNI
jgi:predicted metalloendopeptidase